MFRDLECNEWGLREESATVARQLADQFKSDATTGGQRADDGSCAMNEGDDSIRPRFVVNEHEQL